MAQPDLDITKRTNAARKWKQMADLRLSKEMNKAGGLEDERSYQLAELKRETILLQKELQALRFESRMSARNTRQSYDNLTRSSEDFYTSRVNSGRLRRHSSDYGKNFHGYVSLPGSKKILKKSTRQMERSLEETLTRRT